jgi:hypothetical protein
MLLLSSYTKQNKNENKQKEKKKRGEEKEAELEHDQKIVRADTTTKVATVRSSTGELLADGAADHDGGGDL